MRSTALVEQRYPRPVSLKDLVEAGHVARWCFDTHGCKALFHSVAPDGLSSICVFAAPDAQAARDAARQLGMTPPPAIWGATLHLPPGGSRGILQNLENGERAFALVDRIFERPMNFEEVQAMEDAKSSCLTLHRVRFVGSFLSLDRMRMACVYAAPDVEAVRNAVRLTELPFRAVYAAFANA